MENPTVTVYSKPDNQCQACRLTKLNLDRAGIPHTVTMLDDTPEDILQGFKDRNLFQAPIVVIQNSTGAQVDIWSGFRMEKIKNLKG